MPSANDCIMPYSMPLCTILTKCPLPTGPQCNQPASGAGARILTTDFLRQDQKLDNIDPFVADSGEGRWTVLESVEQGVPTPVMSLSLMMRFTSQGRNDYTNKLLAMMRKGFGGHGVKESGHD